MYKIGDITFQYLSKQEYEEIVKAIMMLGYYVIEEDIYEDMENKSCIIARKSKE